MHEGKISGRLQTLRRIEPGETIEGVSFILVHSLRPGVTELRDSQSNPIGVCYGVTGWEIQNIDLSRASLGLVGPVFIDLEWRLPRRFLYTEDRVLREI